MFSAKQVGIPGSRYAAFGVSSRPGMTGVAEVASNIFSYLPLTVSPQGLYSPLSCPTERGDRDRHVRGVGCGGRRRCGVTRFTGDVCLRAGRICASTATGKETTDLAMERPLDSVTDDQIETRPAYSLEAPFPSPWDFNSVIGSFAEAKCKQPKKHRRRNVGQSLGASESPDALTIAEDRIRIRPKGATGTRRSARPLTGGGNAKHDGVPAPQTTGVMTHV